MIKDACDYLEHILERLERIRSHLNGVTKMQFMESDLLQDAVCRNLEIIGEACGRVLKVRREYKEEFPDIPWSKTIGFRNILIHQYDGINLELVWDVTQTFLPPLGQSVQHMMKKILQEKER